MYIKNPTQKPENAELIKLSSGEVALVVASPTSPKNCPAIAELIIEYADVSMPANTSGAPNRKKVLKIFPFLQKPLKNIWACCLKNISYNDKCQTFLAKCLLQIFLYKSRTLKQIFHSVDRAKIRAKIALILQHSDLLKLDS